MTFRPNQSMAWERYPQCEPTSLMEWLVVRDARVHAEIDRLLRDQPDALPPNDFLAFYERTMAEPNVTGMLDVLAACGIHIVS